MTDPNIKDVIVIGAGIVGTCTALALQAEGRKVTILDRQDGNPRASEMNAGAFAFADIMPLAAPGIMLKAPKWLLDPLGPLSIPPAYALQILPWLLRFWRASLPDRYHKSLGAQANLMKLSQEALEQQIKDTSAEHLIQRDGQLQLYESEREFRSSLPGWNLRREHGVDFKLLKSAAEIAEIQPGINGRFAYAGYTPEWINTCDPAAWLAHLTDLFKSRGGLVETGNVLTLQAKEAAIQIISSAGNHLAQQVIICTGAWSHHLAQSVGDNFPLETERGYNTTISDEALGLRTHLTFPGHGFVVTRINNGIRVGGAVELGGLKLPPNYNRSQILFDKAKSFLPGIGANTGRQWMGFRPSLPDSLPVIGRSSKDPRILYAFGHGHLGLTQAAGTAEIVATIAKGAPPPIDLTAYSPNRF